MIFIRNFTFILVLLLSITHFPLMAQLQGKKLWNEDWKFIKGDIPKSQVFQGANELDWREVDLPHDWSIEGPFDKKWASGTGFLPGGIGWYLKKFDLEEFDSSNHYTIYFDGVYKNSEVWINGHLLGKRPNGFISFYYDLTPYIKPDNNEILVKVDHTDYADSRYYTGSGIYRNVYLITQEAQRIKPWGVFFTSPEISDDHALVKVEVNIQNEAQHTRPVMVKTRMLDREGEVVAESEFESLLPSQNYNIESLLLDFSHPKLWSPSDPYLYELEVSLWADGKQIDLWNDQVGLRTFRFDANEGFFLNGENMLLKGVCIHHDAGGLGAAVPKEVWENRLETLKELGCNAIRMAHYPHQEYLYELCDEMGFLVQDEAFDEWEVGKNKWIEGWNVGTPGNDGYHEAFSVWGKRDVRDMVLRNRNRPSIIMWSIGNEVDYPNDPYSHPVLDEGRNPQIYGKGYQKDNLPASRLGELAEGLVTSVKSVDPTRPVTAALAGVTMSNHTSYPSALDIVGYNYQEYRYQEDHEKYPDRVIYGSENGDALEAWWAVSQNDFIASQFLWTAFDFVGEARPWPARSSGAGIIDMAGYPKPDFYFRKSLWNDSPMVYLGITDNEENVQDRRNIQSAWIGEKGETKWVTCYANTEAVELFLNGRSLGKKTVKYSTEKMVAWKVDFEPGNLKVIGYKDGENKVAYQITTPGKLHHLEVVPDKNVLNAPNKEILHLDISLRDKEGNLVVTDDREVEIEIEGPAQLLVLESGDLRSHEDYLAYHRKTYQGRLRGYIQTNGKPGDIVIKVSTENLPSQEINIKRN